MRLIDAYALMENGIKVEFGYNYDGLILIPMRDVRRSIDNAPTVDAEPVRHGHWEWCETWLDEDPEYPCELLKEGWACSACGVYLMEYLKSHFHDIESYAECISDEMPTVERCPHCGAKMMEKQND